jgi:hypothetical protein
MGASTASGALVSGLRVLLVSHGSGFGFVVGCSSVVVWMAPGRQVPCPGSDPIPSATEIGRLGSLPGAGNFARAATKEAFTAVEGYLLF